MYTRHQWWRCGQKNKAIETIDAPRERILIRQNALNIKFDGIYVLELRYQVHSIYRSTYD